MDKSKKQKFLFKIISRIYVSIKDNSQNSNLLFFIGYIFGLMNTILIIDIIFNYKRDFLNIYFFLYYINPTLYFEILNCKLTKNGIKVNSTRYDNDQIYKIAINTFKITPYEQKSFYNYNIFGLVYLIFICLMFLVHLIKGNKYCCLKVIKKISAYMIYLTYIAFNLIILLIFNRTVFLQFSDLYNEINLEFIYDTMLFLLFNISFYIFYSIYIYAYEQNEIFYFLQSKIFILEFILGELGSFLFILRLNNQYPIIFQLIWSITYIYNFYIRTKYYKYEIHKSLLTKIYFFGRLLIFSMFVIRFISIFLINYIYNQKIFKILEGMLMLIFLFVMFFYFNKKKQFITLSKLKSNLEKGKVEFFEGVIQLFNPLIQFFSNSGNINKQLEKNKEIFFINYKEDLKNYFCFSEEDYNILSGGNDALVSVFTSINANQNPRNSTSNQINNEQKDYNIILTVLISLYTNFYKIAKERNDLFGKKAMEVLIYNKVLLYFISDDKTFRAAYYLKKFIFSDKYDNSSFLIHSIYKYLINHFKKVEKKK